MKTADFDFELPRALIAQRPASPRDSARLLDARADALHDRVVGHLPGLLRAGDLLVFNDTRVIPAQLAGTRAGRKVGLTLHKREGGGLWAAFAKPARRLNAGDHIVFGDGFAAEVLEKRDRGEVVLDFGLDGADFLAALRRFGSAPLPPYIKRADQRDNREVIDYQTLFAARDGAVAAPTAGLHFTPPLMAALAERGVETAALTLHVGAGTFLPVTVENIEDHKMHAEIGEISQATADAVNAARRRGGRVLAVGTTSLRLLESAADERGTMHPFAAETDIFITPGYRFRAVDVLLTNFHLPRSTLYMLVCAFAGTAHMRAAYGHAIAQRYRFYSYGDAMLLQRADGRAP